MNSIEELSKSAYFLADEVRDGKWAHIKKLNNGPVAEWEEIIEELKRRSPGFETEVYKTAISNGLFESR